MPHNKQINKKEADATPIIKSLSQSLGSKRAKIVSKAATEDFTQYHKDGTIWAKGKVIGNTPVDYWEWFRKDGIKMRSGSFKDGIPVGEWTTYDKTGAVHKVTNMKDGKEDAQKAEVEKTNQKPLKLHNNWFVCDFHSVDFL